MFNLKIKSLTEYATRNEEGDKIFSSIITPFKEGKIVMLDFEGINFTTTSFVNTALIPLLEIAQFDQIKKQLRIINSNKHINEMIKHRLEFESKRIIIAA